MKRTIITIFLFFLLGNLYAENNFYLKEDGMLYDSENKPILSKQTWTLDKFEKTYPSMRYLDAKSFQIGNEAPFNLAAYPWVIWGGAHLGFTDFEMEADLVVRWVWLEYPEGNKLQKKGYDYFGGIYQDPPDDISIDILGKLIITHNLNYDNFLKLLKNNNIYYKSDDLQEHLRSHFIDFSNSIVLKIPQSKKNNAWFRIIFNKNKKIIGIQYRGED